MSMVRFDPFRDLAVLQDRMNRLFNEVHSPRQSDDLHEPWHMDAGGGHL